MMTKLADRKTVVWAATALLLASLLTPFSAAWARVAAEIDRDAIALGDTLRLTVRTEGTQTAEPDWAALEEDFSVLGVARSFRTTIVNGQRTDTAEWHATLAPRKLGDAEIPAIAVGRDLTQPIPVQVLDTVAGNPGTSAPSTRQDRSERGDTRPAAAIRPVSLSARVDEASPYVQEQVVLTVRLESAVPIVEGAIADPSVEGAIIERLGEDTRGSSDVEGQPMNWVERRYAIFPQQSGLVEIGSLHFEGLTPRRAGAEASSRRPRASLHSRLDSMMGSSLLNDPFFDDFFGGSMGGIDDFFTGFGPRGETVRAATSPITLDVRPQPSTARGARWLPARSVELVEIWGDGADQPPALKVGEPIERVVAIRARGVTATQLPAPVLPDPDGFKQYTEPDYTDTQGTGSEIVALRAVPATLIPTAAGELELPAVDVHWWDTESNEARTTTLPARPVTVAPGSFGSEGLAGAPPGPGATSPQPPEDEPGPAPAVGADSALGAMPLQYGLYALIAVVFVALARRNRWGRRENETHLGSTRRKAQRRSERDLANACRAGDPLAAEAALVTLGRCLWPEVEITSARSLAQQIEDPEFSREVALLLSSRYGADASAWKGDGLWSAYRNARKGTKPERRGTPSSLPTLYPEAPH